MLKGLKPFFCLLPSSIGGQKLKLDSSGQRSAQSWLYGELLRTPQSWAWPATEGPSVRSMASPGEHEGNISSPTHHPTHFFLPFKIGLEMQIFPASVSLSSTFVQHSGGGSGTLIIGNLSGGSPVLATGTQNGSFLLGPKF